MRAFAREERRDKGVEVISLSRGGSVGVERKGEFTVGILYIQGYGIFFCYEGTHEVDYNYPQWRHGAVSTYRQHDHR